MFFTLPGTLLVYKPSQHTHQSRRQLERISIALQAPYTLYKFDIPRTIYGIYDHPKIMILLKVPVETVVGKGLYTIKAVNFIWIIWTIDPLGLNTLQRILKVSVGQNRQNKDGEKMKIDKKTDSAWLDDPEPLLKPSTFSNDITIKLDYLKDTYRSIDAEVRCKFMDNTYYQGELAMIEKLLVISGIVEDRYNARKILLFHEVD